MEDASHHAATVNILMPFQKLAELAHQLVPPAAPKETVSLVQMLKSSQSEDNVSHASTHAILVRKTFQPANHAKADSTFPTKIVSEPAHQVPDQSTEFALVAQEFS